LPESRQVQWLFWEEEFTFSEPIIHGVENIAAELERFAQKTYPYPQWRLSLDHYLRQARGFEGRLLRKLRRTLS
jgi:hypothetical protein